MVWNKTPDETVKSIIEMLYDNHKSYDHIANHFNCSKCLVARIAKDNLSEEKRKERYSFWNRQLKLSSNHMKGRVGKLHHNAKDEVRVSGYKTVFCPPWYKGKTVKSGRVYEHIYVYCLHNNLDSIPKGYCIHHIDENKDNNTIENLQLLSISDHMMLHSELRKVQRLSRKGVGNSVPEAHSNLNG